MAHALIAVYIHFVWSTKYRTRALLNERRHRVTEHIQEYALRNGITVEAVNVQPEHVHLLVSLSRTQRIEEIAKLVKGESSHWINANDIFPGKFSWQKGYWAGSVCPDHIDTVKKYIENQDDHHKRLSFVQEFEQMLEEHGLNKEQIAYLLRFESR